jgi:Flp pilus assembly protein TadD
MREHPELPEIPLALAGVFEQMGYANESRGQIAAARRDYEAAIQVCPNRPVAHYNLGNLALREPGHLTEAIAHFRDALRWKEDYAYAHVNLGVALERLGRKAEAGAEYKRSLELLGADSPLAGQVRLRLRACGSGER